MRRNSTETPIRTPTRTPMTDTPVNITRKISAAYSTNSPTSSDTLRRNVINGLDSSGESSIQLLMRSEFLGKREVDKVEKEEAVLFAEILLKIDPDHNLANYILGLDAKEKGHTQAAEQYLVKAANTATLPPPRITARKLSKIDPGMMIVGNAARELSILHLEQEQPVEAMTWLIQAILHKSGFAHADFICNGFIPLGTILPDDLCKTSHRDRAKWRSTYALLQTAFIIIVLARCKIGGSIAQFRSSIWLANLRDQSEEEMYIDAYEDKDPERALSDPTSALSTIKNWAIENDPYLFYALLSTCLSKQIINTERFSSLVDEDFLSKATDPVLNSDVRYTLFKIYLAEDEDKGAFALFDSLLTDNFNRFSLSEILATKPNVTDSDKLFHELFIRFNAQNQFPMALECLRRISPAFADYDPMVINFFARNIPYAPFELRQRVCAYIIRNIEVQKTNPDTETGLKHAYERVFSTFAQIRMAVLDCIELFQRDIANREEQKNKKFSFFIFGGSFFSNNAACNAFTETLMNLANDPLIRNPIIGTDEIGYLALKTILDTFIRQGKEKFPPSIMHGRSFYDTCLAAEQVVARIKQPTLPTIQSLGPLQSHTFIQSLHTPRRSHERSRSIDSSTAAAAAAVGSTTAPTPTR